MSKWSLGDLLAPASLAIIIAAVVAFLAGLVH